MLRTKIETRLVSSLGKVFPTADITEHPRYKSGMALRGERFAFQMAFRLPFIKSCFLTADVQSPLKESLELKVVDEVPARTLAREPDEDVLTREPGLFPDVLWNYTEPLRAVAGLWRSLWITVNVPEDCPAGIYPIKISLSFKSETDLVYGSETFKLEVLNAQLPPQKLIVTHWFHADCLANFYRVPVFSEEHWKILDAYFKSFVLHGSNMLLTPLFTPPLDTGFGGERTTTQLMGVTVKAGHYSFDFSKLERWISLAKKNGVRYFEMSHLFTQWGVKYTPKIMATVDGVEKQIFGWDVASDSPAYYAFLDAFLPELDKFLRKNNLQKNTFFHCSDEPHLEHLEMYKKASDVLHKYLKGYRFCDALSNIEFYKKGLVETPIPTENELDVFFEAGVKPLWTYYCVGQFRKVPNRFLHFPSSRNRILGALLYRYDIEGFLQWGFNFWNTGLSRHPLNPFCDTTSGLFFPPADAFQVYPGEDGKPVESIHHEVFSEGIQDLRALRLLEKKIGREAVVALLDKVSPKHKMSMTTYPRGEKAVLSLRKKINELLKQNG